MAGGGPVGQVASNINSSNPLGPQQGQSTPPTGGTGQMPSFANNPFMGTTPFSSVNSTTQQDMMGGGGRGGYGGSFGDFLQRSPGGGFGGQPQPMQQPGRPAFGQSPEFQGYQTQMRGLQQQMDEYMRKAPMYQQLEDLNNKMQGYQQRQQQAMQQQMMQRPSPFRQNPYQRQLGGGIQGLMGILGGRGGMGMASPGSYEQYANANNQALARASQEVKRPTMSRADFDARNIMSMGMPQYQRAMTMDMPQYQGRSFDLPTNFMKNGGKV